MDQLIYCGPNWLKYGLQTFQVYMNGFPANVDEAMRECPEIRELFCKVNELDSFRTKLAKINSREHRLFERVKGMI